MKVRGWIKRRRFDVIQVQAGRVVLTHTTNATLRQASRDAADVNRMLLFCKLMAPSGPQDAHAHIVPTSNGADR